MHKYNYNIGFSEIGQDKGLNAEKFENRYGLSYVSLNSILTLAFSAGVTFTEKCRTYKNEDGEDKKVPIEVVQKSQVAIARALRAVGLQKQATEYINAVSRHEVSDAVRREVRKYYEKSTKGGTCISGEYTIDPSFLPKRVNDGMPSFIVPKPGVAIPEEYNKTGSEPSTPGAKALTKTPNGSCPF